MRQPLLHPCADDIAAHHAAGADHRQTGVFLLRGLCHADNSICHTKQAVLADVFRRFTGSEQGVALVFQPGKAALQPLYAGLGADLLGALRSKAGDLGTSGKTKAQPHAYAIHRLTGI